MVKKAARARRIGRALVQGNGRRHPKHGSSAARAAAAAIATCAALTARAAAAATTTITRAGSLGDERAIAEQMDLVGDHVAGGELFARLLRNDQRAGTGGHRGRFVRGACARL